MIYIEQKQQQIVFNVRQWLSKLAERKTEREGGRRRGQLEGMALLYVLLVNLIWHCRSGAKSKLIGGFFLLLISTLITLDNFGNTHADWARVRLSTSPPLRMEFFLCICCCCCCSCCCCCCSTTAPAPAPVPTPLPAITTAPP